MKVYLYLLIPLCLFFISCNKEEPKDYFPFKQFLEQELKKIDSLPIAIFRFSSSNTKKDTSIIEKKKFREIASTLLELDLRNETLTSDYTELVLEDTDIENIAISYTTEKKQYPIKQIQLNIKPGTTEVKSFYVERTDNINNITIVRKILWTTKKGVTVSSIYYKDNHIKEQLTEKFSWSIQ